MLDTTEEAVTSALKRARAAMPRQRSAQVGDASERALAARFADAMERADVPGMIALLTDDAWMTMPPAPLEYQGHDVVAGFLWVVGFRSGTRRYRLIPTSANGQPTSAAMCSTTMSRSGRARAAGAHRRGRPVSAMTRFVDNSTLPYFGLPRTLPANQ